jgi:photosystem II stability/assembly factor-like uncharacterized protein
MKSIISILVFFVLFVFNSQAQWVQQISGTTVTLQSVKAVNDNVIWIAGDEGSVLNSTNGGTTWNLRTITQSDYINFGVAATDLNTAWVIGTTVDTPYTVKIWKTTNGGSSWNQQYTVVSNFSNNIHFFDSNNGVYIGDPNPLVSPEWNILTTTNGGTSWNRVLPANYPPANELCGEFGLVRAFAAYGDNVWFSTFNIYCPTENNRIYHSSDRGFHWTAFDLPYNGDELSFISFGNQTNGIAISYSSSIFGILSRTTNGGSNWTVVDTVDIAPWAVRNAPGFENFFMVVGDDGIINGKSYYSTDFGNLWNSVPVATQSLYDVSMTTNNAWAVGPNGVILKMNLSSVVPVELTAFTAQSENQKVILNWTTATELNNNGFEIQRKVAESEFATVGFVKGEGTTSNQREYSYIDKELVDGKYFYRLKQIDFNGTYEYSNVIEIDVRSLNEYALEQNYPNPFNPTTTIGYVLKEKSNAKLILLNAIGEEVAVLVNEEQEKGFHKVDFNASTLASGVYFYRLQAGSFVQTRKMILLK